MALAAPVNRQVARMEFPSQRARTMAVRLALDSLFIVTLNLVNWSRIVNGDHWQWAGLVA